MLKTCRDYFRPWFGEIRSFKKKINSLLFVKWNRKYNRYMFFCWGFPKFLLESSWFFPVLTEWDIFPWYSEPELSLNESAVLWRLAWVLKIFNQTSLTVILIEPVHEISNNKECATSKASDQPAHTRSLTRAFASRLSILWLLTYWLNTIWSF